jgi:hypothetical protein
MKTFKVHWTNYPIDHHGIPVGDGITGEDVVKAETKDDAEQMVREMRGVGLLRDCEANAVEVPEQSA